MPHVFVRPECFKTGGGGGSSGAFGEYADLSSMTGSRRNKGLDLHKKEKRNYMMTMMMEITIRIETEWSKNKKEIS